MSLLNTLAKQDNVQEDKDFLGGDRVWETDVYPCTITLAYLGKSSGGATTVTLHYKNEDGSTGRNTQFLTSGTAKGGRNYYEKDGKRYYLPGYNNLDAICQMAVGKGADQMESEIKQVKLYDFELRKETPQAVECLTELHGKKIVFAVQKQTVDKTVKDAAGNYQTTGDTRDENEIVKIFDAESGKTIAEIRESKDATHMTEWVERNKGKTLNKVKHEGGATGTAGAPKAAGAAPAKTSLFAKKAAE
mgnify:CR=1 FL=1